MSSLTLSHLTPNHPQIPTSQQLGLQDPPRIPVSLLSLRRLGYFLWLVVGFLCLKTLFSSWPPDHTERSLWVPCSHLWWLNWSASEWVGWPIGYKSGSLFCQVTPPLRCGLSPSASLRALLIWTCILHGPRLLRSISFSLMEPYSGKQYLTDDWTIIVSSCSFLSPKFATIRLQAGALCNKGSHSLLIA
jgi:hypothetical protein